MPKKKPAEAGEKKRTVQRLPRENCSQCEKPTSPSRFVIVNKGDKKHKLCPTCVYSAVLQSLK